MKKASLFPWVLSAVLAALLLESYTNNSVRAEGSLDPTYSVGLTQASHDGTPESTEVEKTGTPEPKITATEGCGHNCGTPTGEATHPVTVTATKAVTSTPTQTALGTGTPGSTATATATLTATTTVTATQPAHQFVKPLAAAAEPDCQEKDVRIIAREGDIWRLTFSGSKLATQADLWRVSTAGVAGGLVQITNTPSLSETNPVWASTGSIVYVEAGNLYEVDQQGSQVKDLGLKGGYPEIDPTGRFVLYQGIESAQVWDSSTGRQVSLPFSSTTLRWTPDGRSIVYANSADGSLVRFDLKTGRKIFLAHGEDLVQSPLAVRTSGLLTRASGLYWSLADGQEPVLISGIAAWAVSHPVWWHEAATRVDVDMAPWLAYMAAHGG